MVSEFEKFVSRARVCRVCRDHPQGQRLPHEPRPVLRGSARSRILIVGQAPGNRVHKSGIPFTDPSGDRLRGWMGVDGTVFYNQDLVAIIPMGFCFPGLDGKGGDLPPRRECAPLWHADILATFNRIELVIAVGSYALKWHLGNDCGRTLAETVLRWRDHVRRDPPLVALPHPSWRNNNWLKRHPIVEAEVVPDLAQRVRDIVGESQDSNFPEIPHTLPPVHRPRA